MPAVGGSAGQQLCVIRLGGGAIQAQPCGPGGLTDSLKVFYSSVFLPIGQARRGTLGPGKGRDTTGA